MLSRMHESHHATDGLQHSHIFYFFPQLFLVLKVQPKFRRSKYDVGMGCTAHCYLFNCSICTCRWGLASVKIGRYVQYVGIAEFDT
jgi:hypothetical protein